MNKKSYIQTFYRKNKINLIMAVIGTLGGSFLSVGIAVLLQKITDVALGGSLDDILDIIIGSSLFILLLLIFLLLTRYFKNVFLKKAVVQYRERIFEKIMDKNINAFSSENTADYISALTNDVTSIVDNYLAVWFDLITYIVYFCGSIICMLFYSMPMTIFVIIVSCIPILTSVFFGSKMEAKEQMLSDKNSEYVNVIQNMLCGFTVLKGFHAEKHFLKNYNKSNESLGRVKYDRDMTAELLGTVSQILGGTIQISVFLFGAYLAIKEKMTAVAVIAFVQLMNYVLSPVEKIPQILAGRQAAEDLIRKVSDLLEKNVFEDGAVEHKRMQTELCLENVSFKYEDAVIIDNMNLKLLQGKSYAIVGASGSGKTTLLNLLSGRLHNYSGKILIDGIELNHIQRKCVFDIFSIIEQNVYMFDDTIYNNISLYQDVDKNKLNEVIQKANLMRIIEEKGADYQCGENGNKLSGGEKQRISIARSMLRNMSVFLMDEATSALDNDNAIHITEEILSVDDVTKIVVTHKLTESILDKFDEIIVLQNGKVKEHGSFKELMAKKDYFYAMFTLEQSTTV